MTRKDVRLMVSLTPETEQGVARIRQTHFAERPTAEVLRRLMEIGLEAAQEKDSAQKRRKPVKARVKIH